MQEFFKSRLVRTPFEEPANTIRSLIGFRQRSKHPELQEIYMESQRIKQAMQYLIKPSYNCIDVGCHLGSTLSQILKLAPYGHHTAFEAIPYKVRWLKQKFPDVDVREMALSDTPGQVTFYINTSRSGFSGLRQHNLQKNEKL